MGLGILDNCKGARTRDAVSGFKCLLGFIIDMVWGLNGSRPWYRVTDFKRLAELTRVWRSRPWTYAELRDVGMGELFFRFEGLYRSETPRYYEMRFRDQGYDHEKHVLRDRGGRMNVFLPYKEERHELIVPAGRVTASQNWTIEEAVVADVLDCVTRGMRAVASAPRKTVFTRVT